jgi:hypothetical protein
MRRPVLTEIVPKMSNSAILKQTGVLSRSVLDVQDDIRRGYCVDTVGLDSNKIRKYVKYQETKERKAERRRKLFLLIGATHPCLLGSRHCIPFMGFPKPAPPGSDCYSNMSILTDPIGVRGGHRPLRRKDPRRSCL